ncbi:mfs transporter [Moniliophthora roreri]|nr:mfs transporter [Moniliophthora roreri]
MSVLEKDHGIAESGDSPEKQWSSTDDATGDRRLLRKVDLRLLPILTLLYLLSFLDRTNVGNARIIGLADDLKLSPPAYNTSLALYFVAYVIFEVPANPQTIQSPAVVTDIGVTVGNSQCLSRSGHEPGRAARNPFPAVLGVTEAGLFPGVIYVFSVYYRRGERSARVAIFFGGAALAGAFGGILAFAIGKMEGIDGKRGWAWIFILEGLLTVVVAFSAYFLVPTWSYKAKFLTEPERERLLMRLRADSDAANKEEFDWLFVKQAVKDHLVWGYAFLFHGFAFVLYSLSLFMPTIIAGLGFESWQAQLMTVPPNTLAVISIAIATWASIKYNQRAVIIIISAFIAIIGYIILLAAKTSGAQYLGVHFAAAGVYTGTALLLSWPGENVSGQTKRAVAVAMQITIGDIGAIAGVLIYRPEFSRNRYRKPHIIAIGYLLFAAAVSTYLWLRMSRENARRERILSDESLADQVSLDEKQRLILGDRDVHYRYVY